MGRKVRIKRNRGKLKEYVRAMDAKKRREMRTPFWTRFIGFFYPPKKKNWIEEWEKKHAAKLHHAIKDVSRKMLEDRKLFRKSLDTRGKK